MFLRGRLCFHTGRLESKILEEVESKKFEAEEDKVRENSFILSYMKLRPLKIKNKNERNTI